MSLLINTHEKHLKIILQLACVHLHNIQSECLMSVNALIIKLITSTLFPYYCRDNIDRMTRRIILNINV